MILDKYKQADDKTPTHVTVLGTQYVKYESSTVIVQFNHVPIEEVTTEVLRELLSAPDVDCVEISFEK